MGSPPIPARAPAPAIAWRPWGDALLAGGLSLVLGPLVLVLFDLPAKTDPVVLAVTASLLNGPHFLSSYLLVYNSTENVKRYPWAAVGVPALLVVAAVAAVGLFSSGTTEVPFLLFGYAASLYLAVHYTGQAWGMVMTFSFLDGVRWEERDKRLFGLGFRVLMAWHMAWFLTLRGDLPWLHDAAAVATRVIGVLAVLSLPLGGWALVRTLRRHGGVPPRVVAPWVALYLWYGLLAVEPNALFVVQLFHALQYLSFPFRVQHNRLEGAGAAHVGLRLVGAFVVVAVLGGLVFGGLGTVLHRLLPGVGAQTLLVTSLVVMFVINIHHYVIDGAIWKISHPAVRRELFAHLPPPGGASPPPAAAEVAS